MKKQKEFWVFFLIQFVVFGIICINIRAVADGEYLLTAFTDFFIATINFFVIRKISRII